MFYDIVCLNPYEISLELNINVNLLFSNSYVAKHFVFGINNGGGNSGSIAILKAFSIIFGIILAKRGLESYKHGLLLT